MSTSTQPIRTSFEDPQDHIKWLSDYKLLLKTEADALKITPEEYLIKRNTIKTKSYEENEGLEDLAEESKYCTLSSFANSLNLAAVYTSLKKFDDAKKQLEWIKPNQEPKAILHHLNGEIRPIENNYLAVANYYLAVIEGYTEREGLEENKTTSKSQRKRKNKKRTSKPTTTTLAYLKANDSQATIRFFKGSFAHFLGLEYGVVVQLFNESVQLDPGCHIWYTASYKILQKKRKAAYDKATLSFPSNDEETMCREALRLCPNDIESQKNYAMFLREKLKNQPLNYWEENKPVVEECNRKFDDLLINVGAEKFYDNEYKSKVERTIKVNYAEFLLFGKDNNLDRERGENILESCHNKQSPNAYVLHKLAKLCNVGGFTKVYEDHPRSKLLYKEALHHIPNFVHCALEYIRLLSNDGEREREEIQRVFDEAEAACFSSKDLAKFQIERGCYTWRFNLKNTLTFQEDACYIWINVPKGCADKEKVIKNITVTIKNHWNNQNQTGINKWHVVEKLKEIQSKVLYKNDVLLKLVNELSYRPPAK